VEPVIQPGNELHTHHILIYQCTNNVVVSGLFVASNNYLLIQFCGLSVVDLGFCEYLALVAVIGWFWLLWRNGFRSEFLVLVSTFWLWLKIFVFGFFGYCDWLVLVESASFTVGCSNWFCLWIVTTFEIMPGNW